VERTPLSAAVDSDFVDTLLIPPDPDRGTNDPHGQNPNRHRDGGLSYTCGNLPGHVEETNL